MKVLTSTRLLKSGQPCGYPAKGLVLAGLFVLAGMNSFAQSTVTTLANIYGSAGTGSASSTPVLTTTAKFNYPAGIALDPAGTSLFLADYNNNAVRWVSNLGNQSSSYTYSAYVSTDGINHPIAVGIDSNTNIYVLNRGSGNNGTILEFNGNYYITYGIKQLIATNAVALTNATSLTLDGTGNLYVTIKSNTVIRIAAGTNTMTTVGVITNKATNLRGVTVTSNGKLALTDAGNNGIWIMDPANTTNLVNNSVKLTGFHGAADTNGPAAYAAFNDPENIASAGNGILVVSDFNNNKVKEIDASGNVTRLFGVNSKYWGGGTPGWHDGTVNPNEAVDPVQVDRPYGLAIGSGGTVYDTEIGYALLRMATGTGLPPLPPPPPGAPTILVVTTNLVGQSSQITLTWSPVTGATSYNIKRSNTAGTETTIANTAATTYTDTNVVGGVAYFYVVSALSAGGESQNSAEVSATAQAAPVPNPAIGYVSFNNSSNASVFFQVSPSSYTFNNDPAYIVIKGTPGTTTYYTSDGSTPSTTNSSTHQVSSFYTDGLSDVTAYEPSPQVSPTVTFEAIGETPNQPNSSVVSATFNFVTGIPNINGNNAAQFYISDITSGAQFLYTTDGSDPRTNAKAMTAGPTPSTNSSITLSLPFPNSTNVMLFQIAAYKNNYQTSSVVSQKFTLANYVANTISFGFASGEASSQFIGSPGQTFYAPVTLNTLPGTKMYSLQFSLTVTNASIITNAGPPVTLGAYGFQSMLMAPIPPPTNFPTGVNLFTPIPPLMFVGDASSVPPATPVVKYNGTNFLDLETVNTNINLLAVGWLERYTQTNLYNTLSQTLITFSMAHDDVFPTAQQPNGVVVGGYSFTIPGSATNGQQYQIQIIRASATDDGIGAPGSGVLIATPTNGATAGGAPINALKYVTVGQFKYLVGDVYPFYWFNAGDFGYGDLTTYGSSDAEQVFQSAVYGFNGPPTKSDFFDAMDSCGSSLAYLDSDTGYYTNAPAAAILSALFGGNDTTINNMAYGDGQLDVCDVYVTFRRSQDPSLTWFERYWNNGQRVADTGIANHAVSQVASKSIAQPMLPPGGPTVPPQVNFTAGDIQSAAGNVVYIPINATIFGSYPLRVLMLNLTVEPLDSSPALTSAVSFNPNPAIGNPTPGYIDTKGGLGNYSAAWLNSAIAGLTGTVTIGTLAVTIPASAPKNAAYAVHFDHASASPNGVASFPKATLTGLITLSNRTNSSYGDGIPDSWRLRWFGTVNNLLSVSNACPTGDGINNWMKYVAGIDPNAANDFPSTNLKKPAPPGSNMAIHWPSVSGKQYVIQRSSSLYSGWTSINTNTGTGTDVEFDDNSAGPANFYRVQILP